MKLSPDITAVDDLMALVDEGRLGLPEFQRDFVWRPPAVVDLLLSVARRWPIGSFLLLAGPQDFAAKSLDQAPPLTTAELLILDGQQRMTALYQSLLDRGDDVYCINFRGLREWEELYDDLIFSRSRRRFEREFPTVQSMADAGIAAVPTIHDDLRFFEWISFLPPDDQAEFIGLRDEHLGGLKGYDVPIVRLPRDVPLAALSKIFETINRTGIRLSSFDLMIARLYPHEFNLADAWSNAQSRNRHTLERYKIDGIELLKLLALREHLLGEARHIRGIRESDVLGLSADIVKEGWDWAVEAYVHALEFVRDECGVADEFLLPSTTMLLPLAFVLSLASEYENRGQLTSLAQHWFWNSVFRQAYSQGANTQAVADARALLAAVREDESLEWPEPVSVESLQGSRRRNEMLLRGMLSMLIRNGACDWSSGKPLRESKEPLTLHRIFPTHYLSDRGLSADQILNFTVLQQSSSDEANQWGPEPRLLPPPFHRDCIETHLIDPTSLSESDYGAFLETRFRRAIGSVLDLLEP